MVPSSPRSVLPLPHGSEQDIDIFWLILISKAAFGVANVTLEVCARYCILLEAKVTLDVLAAEGANEI